MTVRELHGWSPATVTVNARGKVVSVTVVEPRVGPAELEMLLASRRAELEPRGSHGHTIDEATDPNTQGRVHVSAPTVDFVAKALNREQAAYAKAWPDADMDSLLWNAEIR